VLPALTVTRRIALSRRALAFTGSALLAAAAVVAQAMATPSAPSLGLADELGPTTWAMNVPVAWLAAPAPPLRAGDAIDVLAMRPGDRPYAVPIAYGLTVLAASDRGLLLQVDEVDASALASARSGGLQLVALLRSTR
jgi:hypothetical protein